MNLLQVFETVGMSAQEWVIGGKVDNGAIINRPWAEVPPEKLTEDGWVEVFATRESIPYYPYGEFVAVGRDWIPTPAPAGGFWADCVAWQLELDGQAVQFSCNQRGSRWFARL